MSERNAVHQVGRAVVDELSSAGIQLADARLRAVGTPSKSDTETG